VVCRLLSTALSTLFFRYGFQKVSINQIMKEARMTHGAFYAHFESKEALFSAPFLEILRERGRARLVKAPLSVRKLIALATSYLNLRQQENLEPAPETLLFNEIGQHDERIRPLLQNSYDHLRKLLENRITAISRLKKLDINPSRISDRARAVLASLVGAITLARMLPDETERCAILNAAQTQILALMGVQPRQLAEY
jgi:TetR/AcrR family transcriptional repressor of nem operon